MIIGLNIYQIIYTLAVVGVAGIFYGRKFYKQHQKKQDKKNHRKEWKSRF